MLGCGVTQRQILEEAGHMGKTAWAFGSVPAQSVLSQALSWLPQTQCASTQVQALCSVCALKCVVADALRDCPAASLRKKHMCNSVLLGCPSWYSMLNHGFLICQLPQQDAYQQVGSRLAHLLLTEDMFKGRGLEFTF